MKKKNYTKFDLLGDLASIYTFYMLFTRVISMAGEKDFGFNFYLFLIGSSVLLVYMVYQSITLTKRLLLKNK